MSKRRDRDEDYPSLSILPIEQRALRAQLGGRTAARKRLERLPYSPENQARLEEARRRENASRRAKLESAGVFEHIEIEPPPEPPEPPRPPRPAFLVCDVTKYFEVRVKNSRRTPRIRFEVRAELTIPTDAAEPRDGESNSAWEHRFQNYLEDKVEPVFDRALERWGNGIRRVRLSDGRVEMYQNTLDLDNYSKSFKSEGVLGVEVFDGTESFSSSVSFEIAKYKNDHAELLQSQNMSVREGDLS